jgi:hypothetical protein
MSCQNFPGRRRIVKSRSVYALAIALILGACIFVLTNPELISVAAGSKPAQFEAGECVTGFHQPGENWIVVNRLPDYAVETYLVEEASGRQQAIQVQRIRPCEASATSRAGTSQSEASP